jgi:DNA damage-inducible protein 1
MKRKSPDTVDSMIVIVSNESDSNKELVVTLADPATWDALKEAITKEFNIPAGEQYLSYAGMTLDLNVPLTGQLADGATIQLKRKKFFLSDVPPNATPDQLLQLCDQHENLLPQILSADPDLGQVLTSKDVAKVRMLMMQRMMKHHKSIFEKERERNEIFANPDTAENQKKIEEMLRHQEIDEMHNIAMEENPESFAQVCMLYVPLEVNNVPLKAFVDSGAQMTIMSEACAERCNVLRLMDTRYAGMASGVGTAKILGRIHMVQMKLGNSYFPVSATILENSSMDMLFGLDTLKRYRCQIDLASNTLRMMDGQSGVEEVPFLSEGEIPQKKEEGEGQGMLGGGLPPPPALKAAAGAGSSSSGSGSGEKEGGSSHSSSSSSSSGGGSGSGGGDVPTNLPDVEASSGATSSPNPVAALASLVEMGFPEAAARQALDACGGNAEEAAALLFAST